jgi:hypothetical protein
MLIPAESLLSARYVLFRRYKKNPSRDPVPLKKLPLGIHMGTSCTSIFIIPMLFAHQCLPYIVPLLVLVFGWPNP